MYNPLGASTKYRVIAFNMKTSTAVCLVVILAVLVVELSANPL